MYAILIIAVAGTLLGCTSMRSRLGAEQSRDVLALFEAFGAKHGMRVLCGSCDECGGRAIISLEGEDEAPRPDYYQCRLVSEDTGRLYRLLALTRQLDTAMGQDVWTFGAVVSHEPVDATYRADTILARSRDIRSFYDSLPAYLDQGYWWVISKKREDLPLRWSRGRTVDPSE